MGPALTTSRGVTTLLLLPQTSEHLLDVLNDYLSISVAQNIEIDTKTKSVTFLSNKPCGLCPFVIDAEDTVVANGFGEPFY